MKKKIKTEIALVIEKILDLADEVDEDLNGSAIADELRNLADRVEKENTR